MNRMKNKKDHFESLYRKLNKREFAYPDPITIVYRYENPLDQETAALIASSLSYGRVAQIIKSSNYVLKQLDPPYSMIKNCTEKSLRYCFNGFKHRFTTEDDLIFTILGIKDVLNNYGSIHNLFALNYRQEDKNYLYSQIKTIKIVNRFFSGNNSLLPNPEKGSACKRINMFLRWMIRHDEIDLGIWNDLPSSKLIVPLDIHMYNICKSLKITTNKSANLKTAIEITDYFAKISPEDPVKYDFSLTRIGIKFGIKEDEFAKGFGTI